MMPVKSLNDLPASEPSQTTISSGWQSSAFSRMYFCTFGARCETDAAE